MGRGGGKQSKRHWSNIGSYILYLYLTSSVNANEIKLKKCIHLFGKAKSVLITKFAAFYEARRFTAVFKKFSTHFQPYCKTMHSFLLFARMLSHTFQCAKGPHSLQAFQPTLGIHF